MAKVLVFVTGRNMRASEKKFMDDVLRVNKEQIIQKRRISRIKAMEDDVMLLTVLNIDEDYVSKEMDTNMGASMVVVRSSISKMTIKKLELTKTKRGRGDGHQVHSK